jgi:Transposase IS66 family
VRRPAIAWVSNPRGCPLYRIAGSSRPRVRRVNRRYRLTVTSFQHALCWIHAERLVHKLETFTDQQRVAQQRVRALIWQLYADLKDYRTSSTPCRRDQLRARSDYVFCLHTGFATLDRLLKRRHANKTELLPCSTIQTSHGTPMARRTTTAARSRSATPAGEPAAMLAATAVMPSSDWPRLAPSWGSHSGTISAAGFAIPDHPTVPYLADLIRCRGPASLIAIARAFAPITNILNPTAASVGPR